MSKFNSIPVRVDKSGKGIQFVFHDWVSKVLISTVFICEAIQLFRGECMHRRCTGKIQILRVMTLVFGIVSAFLYIALTAISEGEDFTYGLAVVFEWIAFFLANSILFLYCFVPIKAPQSVFALSGSHWKRDKRVASYVSRKGK